MDEVERLIEAFSARGAVSSPAVKLDVLMDLERLRDGRVVAFLLQVLKDPDEPVEVRMYVLKRLRNGPLSVDERSSVAGALGELLSRGSSVELRLQAALALGEFTDSSVVLSALGSLALEPQELLDLRYSAFTSLERAGPTPECVNLLRRLSNDEILGRSARSALARWRVDEEDT
jgi:HEAT repeat protein